MGSFYPLGRWKKENNNLYLLKLGYAVIYAIYWWRETGEEGEKKIKN